MLGVGPVDRISQANNQLDVRQRGGNTVRSMGMEKIIGRGFPCQEMVLTYALDVVFVHGCGELRSIPGQPFRIGIVKKVNFLGRSRNYSWMFSQVVVKRRGTTTLAADN